MSDREKSLSQARQSWIEGDYNSAYTLFESLLEDNPHDFQALESYARAKYDEYLDLKGSVELFERAYQEDPNDMDILLWLGDLYSLGYGRGYTAATEMYQRALQHDPNSVDAYIGLGLLHHTPKVSMTIEETLAAFQTAKKFGPIRPDTSVDLGMALIESGDLVAAKEELALAEKLLTEAKKYRQAKGIRLIIDKIMRNEPITSFAYVNMSPRYHKRKEL